MSNLRDMKFRIKSIEKTQKLTNAMKRVAGARLRRNEIRLAQVRYFHENLSRVFSNVDFSELPPGELPLIQGRERVSDIGLIVIAGERGLCGSFNNNIIQHVSNLCRQNKNIKLICLGRKALTYFTRHNFPIIFGRSGITEKMNFNEGVELTHEILHLFSDGVVDEVQLLYHRFQSLMVQRVTHEKLIPVTPRQPEENKPEFPQMLYEPEPLELLERLTPFMVASHIYRAVTESATSEQAARRVAMENATDNAEDLIKTLTLLYNRTRQNVITKEMLEVVVGGESLK